MRRATATGFGLALTVCLGCPGGQGTASFTTWGEDYIEQEIPADPSGEAGFVDGWSVTYQKFLVVFHAIEVADRKGKVGAALERSILVDNTKPGVKELVSFPDLDAKHWQKVSYQIKAPDDETEIVAASKDDLVLMRDGGFSIYIAGLATKEVDGTTVTKKFHWGFDTATQYRDCQQPAENGQARPGIVVTEGGEDVSELTTHGDHFFYDRLAESDDPAVKTSLRFDAIAQADADEDGVITLEELSQVGLDLKLYNPSGFSAVTMADFVTALSRTVGHFRGEGECTVSRL